MPQLVVRQNYRRGEDLIADITLVLAFAAADVVVLHVVLEIVPRLATLIAISTLEANGSDFRFRVMESSMDHQFILGRHLEVAHLTREAVDLTRVLRRSPKFGRFHPLLDILN